MNESTNERKNSVCGNDYNIIQKNKNYYLLLSSVYDNFMKILQI